jgi:hypothetical protein
MLTYALTATQTPKPIVHKYLSSNNVLLGRNLCAKVRCSTSRIPICVTYADVC